MNLSITNNLHRLSLIGLSIMMSVGVFAWTMTAKAHQDPGACSSNGVGLSLTIYRNDGVTAISGDDTVQSGETIKYQATLSHLGGTNCNFSGGTLEIVTPDGVPHTVTDPVPLVSAGNPHVSSFQSYVVSEDDVVGSLLAEANYVGGASHTGAFHNNAQASVDLNTPYLDSALEVSKTAIPATDSECLWEITKTVDVPEHNLITGNSGMSNYTVTVTNTSCEGTSHSVSGVITITNPSEFADAMITDVTDDVGGVEATVDCSTDANFTSFPYALGPDETLTCDYSADLPDGTTRTNTATAETSGDVDGGEGTAEVNFGSIDVAATNETVNIDDTYEGALGECTYTDEECVFQYERQFTCDADMGQHDNTATIVETEQEASASVMVNCEPPEVTEWCSPGYWRNHEDSAQDAAIAGGFALNDTYASHFGSAPVMKKKAQKDGASSNPTLWEVLQNPQWYGGDAFNSVGDLLSEAHPDVDFEEGDERVENSCPLN